MPIAFLRPARPRTLTISRFTPHASLLATTSLAALLLGAPAQAGQNISNQTVATVTNPAGNATTSIVIFGSTVTGAVTNAGTITPGLVSGSRTMALSVTNSTIGGGIANTGTISVNGANNVSGIFVQGGTVIGAIANSGTITTSTGGQNNVATGIALTNATVSGSNVTGGIANTGTITESAGGEAVGIFVGNGTITGGIANTSTITTSSPSGLAFGIVVQGNSTISGGITNGGTITATSINGVNGGQAVGIFLLDSTTVSGGIANTSTISASSTNNAVGILVSGSTTGGSTVAGGIANSGTIRANGGTGGRVSGIVVRENNTVSGGIANSGTISAVSGGGHASGIFIGGTLSGGIANSGTITAIGGSGVGILVGGTLSGGIANSGTITASAPGGNAVGIRVGTTGTIAPTSLSGGITNAGTITATGKTGIGISVVGASTGGITNNGTITGSTSAIDLTQEIGGATVVTQAAGALVGSVLGSGNANADVLNFTGGRIVLSPAQSVAGFGSYTQTGGTLVLGVTGATTPGSFASVSAGTVALRGGALQLVTPGNLMGFTATQTYRDIISATNSLSGSFASVTTTNSFFTASVSPDATTPNALDATLSLSPTGLARLAPSAQDLTQNLRLGLDTPQVLGQAVEDRLIASGGVLSEGAWDGADVKGPVANATPIGHANLWVRGADQFGSASGHGVSPSYDVNRAAPLIGGVDWRFDHGIVAGVAATYVATSASFKDGSRTSVNSYQGAAYAGWAGFR